MKITKEFKVGLLALISGVILYLGFNYLKGIDFFSKTNYYYVVYDNVQGLQVSNPVTISGFQVGRVSNIKLLQDDRNRVLVRIDVSDIYQLPDSTKAVLNKDILGELSIVLFMSNSSTIHKSGDTLVAKVQTSIMEMVDERFSPIIGHLDSTILHTNRIMAAIPDQKVKSMVTNLEVLSNELKLLMVANRSSFTGTMSNVEALTASLVQTEKALKPLIKSYNDIADSLKDSDMKATVAQANLAMTQLAEIQRKINAGEGTMGALVNDKTLYTNLNTTILSLNKVLSDFYNQPNFYLAPLGKKKRKASKNGSDSLDTK